MKLNMIVFDVESLKHALLESDALTALEGVSENVLDVFCGLLLGGAHRSGLDVTPASYFDATGLAGDDAFICRIVWRDKHIATALQALERYRDVLAVHENLCFQTSGYSPS
jgi:hypothetical protein